MLSALTQAELAFLLWMQETVRTPLMDKAMAWITRLGDGGALWIAVALAFLLFRRTRRAGVCMAIALIFMLLLGNLGIKGWVARPRPCHIHTIPMLVDVPSSYSFPSGHTASAFAAVFALVFLRERLWKWLLVPAIVLALSRLYVFVHFPTDVLGGVLIGLVCGILAAQICNAVSAVNKRKA